MCEFLNSVGKLSHPLLPKDPSTETSKEEADSSHRSMQADPAYAALARGTYTGVTSALGEAENSLDKLVTVPANTADNSFVKASTKTTMRRIWSDTAIVGAYQRVLAYKKAARLATSAVSVASAPRIDTNHATRHNVALQSHIPSLDTKNAETLRPNRPAPPATRRANASSECSKSDVERAAQLPHAGDALARSSEVLEDPAAATGDGVVDSSADLLEKVRADLLEKAKATRATMWTSTTAVIPVQMHQDQQADEQERLHEQPSEWSNEEIEKWFEKHLRLQAMVRDSAIKTLRPAEEQKTVLDTALAVVHESMHETEAFVHAVEKELEALGTSRNALLPNGEDLTEELADKDEQILKKHQAAQEDDQVHAEANEKMPARKPSAGWCIACLCKLLLCCCLQS